MKAAITSNENRVNSRIVFDINESGYSESGNRTFTQIDYIDGTGDMLDWGFQYTKLEIGLNGIELSHDDFEILKGMQRDNDYTFYFHYLTTTYPVLITETSKVAELGSKVVAAARLTVSSTPTEMETS